MKPLEDVRVLAVEQYAAGPWGSSHLAELGADIIKIEDPATGGDIGRRVPPFQSGDDSLFFETFNRNKRSMALDLTSSAGRLVFEDLVRCSDVVYSNLRGDVPGKLGILYDDLRHLRPQIVCCSLSAYGTDSSRAAEPGYDYMLQGLTGWMWLTGEPDAPPQKTGLSLVDYASGLGAATAVLAGVHAARRDGIGMDCDVALFDTALGLLTYLATWHLTGSFVPERTRHSAHPSLVPFQNFETADGWIVVGCAKEKFWRALTVAMLRPELADDARFATFDDRLRNRDVLLSILEKEFRTRTTPAWLQLLRDAGVPCSPVNDVATALRDPLTRERQLVVETDHPDFGRVRQLASPVRVGGVRGDQGRAPRPGEHTAEILGEILGYNRARIGDLARAGAFGQPDGGS